MTRIIAIGTKGENIVFDVKSKAMERFSLSWCAFEGAVKTGRLVEDPLTGNKYCLDELVDEDYEPEDKPKAEAKKCKEKCDDWEDWD